MACSARVRADASIGNAAPNDIAGLLTREATLRQVLFNGQTARRLFDDLRMPVPATVELITLPSTSPANARAG